MDDSERDEGLKKKIKYVPPELISLDKDNGADGQPAACAGGSGAGVGGCNPGLDGRIGGT